MIRWRSGCAAGTAASDDDILDAAVQVLGHDRLAPLERVASRAGADPRDVKSRFPTRDALVTAAVIRGAQRIAAAAVMEDGTPAEQVALLLARIWDDQAPVANFTPLWMRSELRSEVEQILDPVRVLLGDAISRGAGAGAMRADLPESTVAWLVEHAVLTCLSGVADGSVDPRDGRRLALTYALTSAGLAWDSALAVTESVEARLDRH
ncbi:TetR/AcrR family transcriptional regulator [Demequina sp.]|uniref:TetR/AcrR family transcriptional regulator n=1 Tax=Demequina sp. TaxID=2050685 RepID=UPI003A8798FB